MKKLILTLSLLLFISACTSNTGFPNDDVLYTIKDTPIKKSNLYESMKKEDQSLSIYELLSDLTYDNIKIDEDTLDALVKTEIASLEDVFKGDLLATIQSIGFKDLQEYIEKQLKPSLKVETMVNKDIEDHATELVETYKIKEIQFLMSDVEGLLEDQKKIIESGTPMTDIKLDDKAKYFKDFVSKNIPLEIVPVKDYINKTQKPGLSSVLYEEESKLYYLVEILDTDMTQDIDRLSSILYQNESYVDVYLGEQFKASNLKIYDKEIYKQFKNLKPNFIK